MPAGRCEEKSRGSVQGYGWVAVASNRWYATVRCPPAWARQRSSAQLPAGGRARLLPQDRRALRNNPSINQILCRRHTLELLHVICVFCNALWQTGGHNCLAAPGQARICGFPDAHGIFICTVCNTEHCRGVRAFTKRLLPSLALFLKSLTSSTPPLSSIEKKKQHVI